MDKTAVRERGMLPKEVGFTVRDPVPHYKDIKKQMDDAFTKKH
jgi:hypothetical protein